MDKLLDLLAEVFRQLVGLSPVASVLFLMCVALGLALRHLYKKNEALMEAAVAREATAQTAVAAAVGARDLLHRTESEAKDCELRELHERTAQRDQANAKILEQLKLVIQRQNANQGPLLRSCWNGLDALVRFHQLDSRAVGLYHHDIVSGAAQAAES